MILIGVATNGRRSIHASVRGAADGTIRISFAGLSRYNLYCSNQVILSRTVDKFLTRKRMLKQSQQWSHRTVDVSPSEEAHRLMNKFDGCSNSS